MTLQAKIRTGLLGLALFQGAGAMAAELIVNGGFETGDFTGWTLTGAVNPLSGVSGANPYQGNFSAFFSPNRTISLEQTFLTSASAPVTVSFWFAHEAGTATPVNIFSYSFGGAFPTSFGNFGGLPFTNISLTPASGGLKTLKFTFFDARPTRFFLDSVSVRSVPEPASWAMLVIGFGLIGLSARQRPRAGVAVSE